MIDVCVYALDGCQDTPAAIELVRETARELELAISFSQITITSPEDVQTYQFPGSPTIRLNGLDIEPEMRETTHWGMT